MKIHLRGKIVATESPEPFADQNGQMVTYFRNFIKSEDGELFESNSKNNYSEYEGETGICTFNAYASSDKKLYKLSLVGFEIVEAGE